MTEQLNNGLYAPGLLGTNHLPSAASGVAGIYMHSNPTGFNQSSQTGGGGPGPGVSGRNSNKRGPQRMFMNNGNNGVIAHQKRQPPLIGGSTNNIVGTVGYQSAPGNTIFYESSLSDNQRRKQGTTTNTHTGGVITTTASHAQVPGLALPQNNLMSGTSIDSKGKVGSFLFNLGNQSSTERNGAVQIISRKFIHFVGNNPNAGGQLLTSRAATHSQKRQSNNLGLLPLAQLNNHGNNFDSSPRDLGAAPSSGRSGRSGKSTGGTGPGLAELLQQQRGPLNGRLSQRKSNGGVKFPGQNAVSAPHHQLGYRRQQIMDITEDSNTNSKNRLTIGGGGGQEETMNSVESDHRVPTEANEPSSGGNGGNSGPAYSMFYHSNGDQQPPSINRFNSKKNLAHQKKLELINSPYSNTHALSGMMMNGGGLNKEVQQFQFTRKQTLMNADNSLSATRGAGDGVKVIKLKKPQPIKIALHRESIQSIAAPTNSQSIGKRRPLIIRKNNYISGQGNGGSNERGSQKEFNDTNPFNKTSNFNTLMGVSSTNQRLNNTNSFVGGTTGMLITDPSLSNTTKNNTGGISQILKTLNQTSTLNTDSLHPESLLLGSTNKMSMQQLKDASKLIRNNMSKKKLDTARKSRLHQIHIVQDPDTNPVGGTYNSLSQQPNESRQPNPLSQMMKKKRSLILPKGKQAENETLSSNGGGSLSNVLINRPSDRGSRGAQAQRQIEVSEVVVSQPNMQTKMTSKSEERNFSGDPSAPSLQQPKILSRGQIMRMQKQKQQQNLNSSGIIDNLKHHRNSTTDNNNHDQSPIQTGTSSNKQLIHQQKSSKSLRNSNGTNSNHLPRVESKKDLQYVFNGMNQNASGSQVNLEKHFVKEELVILENIHDSSGTPGDFQFQVAPNQKTMHIQEEQKQHKIQLNQPSITDDSKAQYEEFEQEETDNSQNNAAPQIVIQNQSEPNMSFGSGQKEKPSQNTSVLVTAQKSSGINFSHVKGPGPEVNMIPITEEDVTQDTSQHNQHRLLNSSIAQVKSPILTTTSFKSQNSQQAGPNLDEIIVSNKILIFQKFPMRPGKALKLFLNQLTDFEKGEILDYQEIYFLGLNAQKVNGSPKEEYNYGYDDDKGDYKVIMKDHIGYRYEIISFLGKGSFGTALKCFDHKTKTEVALKIVKNKKKYAYQAGIELKILNFLKENDPDDIMNVIHMKDYVIFRKHLCISFELLSMNLFEFLKINDFNGFDHNLIRRFAIQLLYALKYLREFQIIHCDLKPENILLKEANKSGIKIIDFGSSTFLDERVYTYIQSRFYRAPEIMLGIPYTCAIDMWSFGCIMAELYIGYPIFPGESENDQMSRIIEMINIPQQNVYAISQRRAKFFTENAETGEYEPIMLKNSRGKLRKPGGKPLSLLLGDEDLDFLNFVQKCLEWDPEQRMTPDEALRHIWILKGLPPQVLVHHQRMHNIATPELPQSVRQARDQFFLDLNQENNIGSANSSVPNTSQSHSSHVKSQNNQQQPQSTNQAKNVIQNVQPALAIGPAATTGKSASNPIKLQNTSNIKAETIKSLERAQLKNQLHQLNPQKVQLQQQQTLKSGGGGNINLHSKIQLPSGFAGAFTDSHRSDNSAVVLGSSTNNTARLQQQLAQISSSHQRMQNQHLNTHGGATISPNKGGDTTTNLFKQAAQGFKRRTHQAAARHQRNVNLVQRTADAFTS